VDLARVVVKLSRALDVVGLDEVARISAKLVTVADVEWLRELADHDTPVRIGTDSSPGKRLAQGGLLSVSEPSPNGRTFAQVTLAGRKLLARVPIARFYTRSGDD
jgi:hypothetical protein